MLLPILHLFNDGYLAAMPLILPFASEEFALSLGVVGLLGSLLSFSGIILAIPAGVTASKFGALRLLSIGVLFYSLGFLHSRPVFRGHHRSSCIHNSQHSIRHIPPP